MESMRRAIAVLALVAGLAALWLAWPAHRPAIEPRAKDAPSAATDPAATLEGVAPDRVVPETRSAEVAAPAAEAPGTIDAPLRVRSEAGLPLAWVELGVGDEPWRRVPLEAGACDLAGIVRPLQVRAPGHLQSTVAPGNREVVLVPDALFTIEAPGLRACVDSIVPFHGFLSDTDPAHAEIAARLAGVSTWDFVSDDRWAIAASAPGLAGVVPHAVVDVAFVRADRGRSWVSFDVTPGARGTWNPSCDGQADVADLEVRVVRREGTERGELELHAWLVREGSQEAVTDNFPGGRAVRVSDVYLDARIGADTDRTTIPRLPLGRRFSLTARDVVSSAYGRVGFEHDGSARDVRLLQGLEITGRLVAADGSPLPAHARFWWEHLGPDVTEGTWSGEVSSADVSEDGSFRLRSPTRVPGWESATLDLPRQVELLVQAAGFEEYRHSFDTGGAHQLDCGNVLLTPRRPSIVLAPGHGLARRAADWQDMRFASRPDATWKLGECRAMADGSLTIFLRDAEPEFPADPGKLVVLHALGPAGDAGHAFRRGSDGRYEAVPEQRAVLEIHCRALPSNAKRWTIGWQWQGLWDIATGVGSEALGERVRLEITAPADGAQLWWSSSGLPPSISPSRPGESGSVPFQASPWNLELP
jgi:hypothetical protein